MAVAVTPDSRSGTKKAVDAELNLVPFIDLLVCCICFLLITAVWTRLAQLPAEQGSPSTGPTTTEAAKGNLTVLVAEDGYTVSDGIGRNTIPKLGRHYDIGGLGRLLGQLPQRPASLTVAVADGVAYRHLVDAMEVARKQQIERVRVSDEAQRL